MTLGQKIALYRQEHELSVRAFSRMSGLSPTYVSYLEAGKTQRGNPPVASIDTYKSVARAMKIQLDDLLAEVEDEVAINRKSGLTDAQIRAIELIKSIEDDAVLEIFIAAMEKAIKK